jgi:hypothetical protein
MRPPQPAAGRRRRLCRRLEAAAAALGAFRHPSAVECALTLNPGDLLAVYSDGVAETGRDRGAEFGEEVRIWGGPVPEDGLRVAILRGRTD